MRGHHIYKSVWTPFIGEELYLEPEESNEHDEYAVAVRKDGETVGHAPVLSRILWYFLKHAGEITCDHWEKKAWARLGSSMHIYVYVRWICLVDSQTVKRQIITAHTLPLC